MEKKDAVKKNIPVSPGGAAKSTFKKVMVDAVKNSALVSKGNAEYDPILLKKLKSIIVKYTEHPELLEDIAGQTNENFIEKLNIDSIDFVEIIVDTEEMFSITIEDEEIKKLTNFDELYNLIQAKIKNKNPNSASKA